jgi:DNA-binding MarR family transcriptional regulator
MPRKSQGPHFSAADRTQIRRRAWRALMVLHGTLTPLLDAEMQQGTKLDLQTYDALLHAYEAGTGGIRMIDLARRVVLSKSGLTAAVDRLERQGWVKRVPDPKDRRATRITLTARGEAVFRRAAEVHVAGIEKHFASRLTDEEAAVIAGVLERIRDEAAPK